jgi:hypothetical protein
LPADPAVGDFWYENVKDGRLFVWDGVQWVDAAPAGEGGGTSELLKVETTVTDADVLLVANTRNVLTVSGLTALRTALFPAGVVDDVIEVELATDAPTDYELIIAGDTGVSMRLRDADAVTAAELTRMFIRGEAMRFVHDGTDWVCTALDDGRIPCVGLLSLTTGCDGEPISVFSQPTDYGGVWTALTDIGKITFTSNGRIVPRRGGNYTVFISLWQLGSQNSIMRLGVNRNAQAELVAYLATGYATGYQRLTSSDLINIPVPEEYLAFVYSSLAGSVGLSRAAFGVTEVL